jgi:hypothetical protein
MNRNKNEIKDFTDKLAIYKRERFSEAKKGVWKEFAMIITPENKLALAILIEIMLQLVIDLRIYFEIASDNNEIIYDEAKII